MAQKLITDPQLDGISGSKVSGNISGNAANVTGTVAVANGGTGATTLTGVLKGNGTSAVTASSVDLTTEVTGTLPVGSGGTGATSLTANNVLLGNGTSALQVVAPGASGNVLTSNGTTWTSAAPAGSSSNTYKEAVRVATTANGTLASAFQNGSAVDGVTLATGDRILIKNQTSASENGIYTVNASGAPTRATDFDTTGAEVANGAIIPVQFGTINGGSTWQLVQNGGTIGNNFRFAPVNGIAGNGQSSWTTPIASGANSLAIGNSTSASATRAIAIGGGAATGAAASGQDSISVGVSSAASGTNAIAIGTSTTSAQSGTSIGSGARVQGTGGGVAIGLNSTASSNTPGYAVAVGVSSFADVNSLAVGPLASANTSGGVAVGLSSNAGKDWSVAIGNAADAGSTFATALNSVALGAKAVTEMQGEVSLGGGGFANNSDCRISMLKYWVTTTNNTATEIRSGFNSGVTTTFNTTPNGVLILANDSSYIFDCDIVARNTTTDTETAAWNLKFVIRRGTSAANTAIVGTATKTVLAQDTGTTTWDVSVTADTTNGRPNISVTGEAAKTIRWVANIRMTKVTG